MRYTSRGLKRRRGTDKWDVTLSHRDPLSGELVSTYHTVEGTTRKKAEKARDELILELELRGDAYNSKLTLSFTVEQLRAMLAEAERREAGAGEARFPQA